MAGDDLVHGEVKVWRFDGQVERPSRDAQGEWQEVAVTPAQFSRYVRHTPLRVMPMNEDFIVLDRDGHWQTGRKGDYVVLDDGYLRIEPAKAFVDQHRQIPDERVDMALDNGLSATRQHLAWVFSDVLEAEELPLDPEGYERLGLALADAAMATIATL